MKQKIMGLILLSLVTTMSYAASNQTTTVQSSATIGAACTASADNINFGNFSPNKSYDYITLTTNIYMTCTKGTGYSLELSNGNSPSGSLSRYMTGGNSTDHLSYNVYTDSGHSKVFFGGGTTIGGYNINGVGTGVVPIYSIMSQTQFVTPDNYSDMLTVTVIY